MRIYYSTPDELMLLDSLEGMNALHACLQRFLASGAGVIRLDAELWGGSEPHDELLPGLEVEKGEGPVLLSMTPAKWLHLTGSPENLRRYVSHFHFGKEGEGEHHHPEHVSDEGCVSPISMSIILEVSSAWIRELKAKRHSQAHQPS
ncbi:MAG TPA: hypothetical protein VKT74_05550 [Gammaproteobacteria bacterium]|nr:hypothetical protein [Gammaproteobacteria bacterium]